MGISEWGQDEQRKPNKVKTVLIYILTGVLLIAALALALAWIGLTVFFFYAISEN
jgi:hypothetical protein